MSTGGGHLDKDDEEHGPCREEQVKAAFLLTLRSRQ
jgi:hypothetical protein